MQQQLKICETMKGPYPVQNLETLFKYYIKWKEFSVEV
jgi:hypothetical protein